MNEVHGFRVKQISAAGVGGGQEVAVEDRGEWVLLRMSTSSFPAAMTPDEARFLAKHLVASADRIAPRAIRVGDGRIGVLGGKARAAALSPERRSEIASIAGRARWKQKESA